MEETTTKKKKEIPASHSYKCTNPSCQKTFTNPIKVENLSLNNSTVYEACPYCLTEITGEKASQFLRNKNQWIKEIQKYPVKQIRKFTPPQKQRSVSTISDI